MVKVAGRLAVVALAACVLGACGGDDDDASPGPTTAAVSPQATQAVSTPDATEVPATATPGGVPTLTPEQTALVVGLPTADDFGPGWKEQSRGPVTATNSTMCEQTVDFTNADVLGSYLNLDAGHAFVVVGIARRAEEGSLDRLRAALADCNELTSTTAGQPSATYTVEPIEFATFGDDTLAMKVTTNFYSSALPAEGYFIIVRDGDLEMAIADIFITKADVQQTETIVNAAYEALQRIESPSTYFDSPASRRRVAA